MSTIKNFELCTFGGTSFYTKDLEAPDMIVNSCCLYQNNRLRSKGYLISNLLNLDVLKVEICFRRREFRVITPGLKYVMYVENGGDEAKLWLESMRFIDDVDTLN